MSHADVKTTMRYLLHRRGRGEAARRLGEAFSVGERAPETASGPAHLGNGTEHSSKAGPAALG
jgi:hypothetical protein